MPNDEKPTLFETWMKDGLSEWVFPNDNYLRQDLHAVLYVLDEHLKERYALREG